MRILFITRKYPPQKGGMEAFSFGLINNIKCDKETIILNKSQKNLFWWLPYALVLSLIKTPKVDRVHLCDGLLAPIGLIIKKICHKPVSVTVHGLDVTYNNYIYQKINVGSLKYLDQIICVSESTKQDCLAKNISEKKLFIIPDGIEINNINIEKRKTKNEKLILLTVGRLVKRKGVEWFIRNIVPKLNNIEYWVVGKGPEKENIEKVVKENNLENKVKLLGFVDDEKLKELYCQADIFIMPNIRIGGDREGFGIVALEAGANGLPVMATDIEGMRDVIKNGENGFLIEAGNSQLWVEKIEEINHNELSPEKIIAYIKNNFSWGIICNKYIKNWEK
jgi:phosphatidylinositol alpha-1,6-mannosyltransferase